MLQPVSQIEMLDRHLILAEIVVTFPEREMKIRLLVIGEFAFLQHPFHLSEERTIRLGQLLDVDELVICVDLPPVESKCHIGEWGCLMEAAQLHQNGAHQAVGITVARSEIDRAPHQLLGSSLPSLACASAKFGSMRAAWRNEAIASAGLSCSSASPLL